MICRGTVNIAVHPAASRQKVKVEEPETYWGIVKEAVSQVFLGSSIAAMGCLLVGGGIAGIAAAPFVAAVRTIRHTYSKLPSVVKDPVSDAAATVVNSRVVQAFFTPFLAAAEILVENGAKLLPVGGEAHRVARNEKPDSYPERQTVKDHQVSWGVPYRGYRPHYYVAPVVLQNDSTVKVDGWADPEDRSKLAGKIYKSFEGEVSFDSRGMPLNPKGRTGLEGRGLLGKWGANFAADPIVTRIHPETGRLEILLIERTDCGQWALPGGMVDDGEVVTKTLARELKEETGIELDFENAPAVYRGYVDDRRNTDNAWMETTAVHVHLRDDEISHHAKPRAGDDARKAQWVEVIPGLKLYAMHNDFVKKALLRFSEVYVPGALKKQVTQFLGA